MASSPWPPEWRLLSVGEESPILEECHDVEDRPNRLPEDGRYTLSCLESSSLRSGPMSTNSAEPLVP